VVGHLPSAPLLPPATLNPTIAVSPILSTKNFPETLYDIISVVDYSHIIAWLPHGRVFFIHDRQRFASEILTRFFDGAKFKSFTRRLKRWNYARVPRGPEMGAYYNPNFKRDQPDLVRKMRYRKEGEDDKVADEAEENLEDQSELEVVKQDNENPPQKTSGPPMPLQDTNHGDDSGSSAGGALSKILTLSTLQPNRHYCLRGIYIHPPWMIYTNG